MANGNYFLKKHQLLKLLCSILQFTLLYQVKDGSSNKSFGIEVARLAGFPSEVLEDAKTYLETAEMPLLRNSKVLDGDEVASFIANYVQTNDKKRKQEMRDEMKSKIAKLMEEESN